MKLQQKRRAPKTSCLHAAGFAHVQALASGLVGVANRVANLVANLVVNLVV